MLVPAGTDGMAVHVTRMMGRVIGITSVSYTHLDVYKRQHHYLMDIINILLRFSIRYQKDLQKYGKEQYSL